MTSGNSDSLRNNNNDNEQFIDSMGATLGLIAQWSTVMSTPIIHENRFSVLQLMMNRTVMVGGSLNNDLLGLLRPSVAASGPINSDRLLKTPMNVNVKRLLINHDDAL